MKAPRISRKSHGILNAIADGHSISQILAADRSLTCHDVFHAVSEAPTNHWRKALNGPKESKPDPQALGRKLLRHRID
jgi:hypothetical protein